MAAGVVVPRAIKSLLASLPPPASYVKDQSCRKPVVDRLMGIIARLNIPNGTAQGGMAKRELETPGMPPAQRQRIG